MRPIKNRQSKWIGNTLRGESLLKTVIEGKMSEKEEEEDQDKDVGLDDGGRT